MIPTLRRFPLEFWRASSPPGPKLLLRDFLSLVVSFVLTSNCGTTPMSAVAFSLSSPDGILDRGAWAMERRERGRVAAESGRTDMATVKK